MRPSLLRPTLHAKALALVVLGILSVPSILAQDLPGVVGDGVTLMTGPLQRAIDACAAKGGGILSLPKGRYLTGTIELKSHVTLRLEAGAVLLGSTNPNDYRNLDPFIDGSGNPLGHSLIVAVDADHVGLVGPGTVDGQSPALKARETRYTLRPFLVRWVRCTNVTVRDIRLMNPGAWTLNLFRTKGALIENVTIRSRGLGMPNNDGINIDSSENIRIHGCDVVSGDDALVIKATSPSLPSRNIIADSCTLSTSTNAIKLGTESIGGFEHIEISHCQIRDTTMSGIALYEVDGASLENVTVTDVTMDGVAVALSVRLGARLMTFRAGDQPRPLPGRLRNVVIKHVVAKNIRMIGFLINGVPGYPVEDLTLEDIDLEMPGGGSREQALVQLPEREKAYPEYDTFGKVMPASSIYVRHVRGISFANVRAHTLKPDGRPTCVLIDTRDVSPPGFPAPRT